MISMTIIYSEEVRDLFDLIRPYIDFTKIPATLKDDAPDYIKEAEALYCELRDKEKEQYLKAMGLI